MKCWFSKSNIRRGTSILFVEGGGGVANGGGEGFHAIFIIIFKIVLAFFFYLKLFLGPPMNDPFRINIDSCIVIILLLNSSSRNSQIIKVRALCEIGSIYFVRKTTNTILQLALKNSKDNQFNTFLHCYYGVKQELKIYETRCLQYLISLTMVIIMLNRLIICYEK